MVAERGKYTMGGATRVRDSSPDLMKAKHTRRKYFTIIYVGELYTVPDLGNFCYQFPSACMPVSSNWREMHGEFRRHLWIYRINCTRNQFA